MCHLLAGAALQAVVVSPSGQGRTCHGSFQVPKSRGLMLPRRVLSALPPPARRRDWALRAARPAADSARQGRRAVPPASAQAGGPCCQRAVAPADWGKRGRSVRPVQEQGPRPGLPVRREFLALIPGLAPAGLMRSCSSGRAFPRAEGSRYYTYTYTYTYTSNVPSTLKLASSTRPFCKPELSSLELRLPLRSADPPLSAQARPAVKGPRGSTL